MSIKKIKLVQRLIPQDLQEMRRALIGQNGTVDLLRVHPDIRIGLERRNLVNHVRGHLGAPAVPFVEGIRLETDHHLWNQRGHYEIQLQAADIIEVMLVEEAYEDNSRDFALQALKANAAIEFKATQIVVHPAVLDYMEAEGLVRRRTEGSSPSLGQKAWGLTVMRNPAFILAKNQYFVEVANCSITARFEFTLPL